MQQALRLYGQALAALLVLACSDPVVSGDPQPVDQAAQSARLLVLNLASADAACAAAGGGICSATAEQAVQARVAELEPDVVVFTHVGAADQSARILPEGYTVRCGADGVVCVAVRSAAGEIAGCASGLCTDLPMAEAASGCGPSDSVADVNVVLPTGDGVNLIAVDLPYTDDTSARTCRAGVLQRLFESSTEVVGAASSAMPVLAAGTFGLDPYAAQDTMASLPADLFHWASYVGNATEGTEAKPYVYLSGIKTGAAVAPPTTTLLPAGQARIDHVIGRSVVGGCYLLDGTTPMPLEGVTNAAVGAGVLSHYGYLCELLRSESEP